MATSGDVRVEVKLDKRLLNWFETQAPQRLKTAKKNAVEAAGMVWADESKEITRAEDHIDTSLYINSIGYSTGSPSSPLHELTEERSKTTLKTGADISYAAALEKRYAIMARGLDRSHDRIQTVATTQVKRALGL